MEDKTTAPAPKKRKIQAKTQSKNLPSQATPDTGETPLPATPIPIVQVGVTNLKIQQAKKYAVTQAQQEGWLGNFRSFDSPFGNYLVPLIPTHADLFGAGEPKNC